MSHGNLQHRKHHRVIWAIALVAAVAAAGVISFRARQDEGLDVKIDHMLRLLDHDPQARVQETRDAVDAVVNEAQRRGHQQAETLYGLAIRRHGRGNLAGAEAALRDAIAIRPSWAVTRNGLGIVLFAQGRIGEAEETFRKAIALDPGWYRPHNDLAVLLRLNKRMVEAEIHAKLAIDADPKSLDVHNTYGNLLMRLERYGEAAEEYQRALAINPKHPWPNYNLACLYAITGEPQRALDHLTQAITLHDPFRQEAYSDPDLDALREDPRFLALLNTPPGATESDQR
jgi:Flp pilus assembly protein TadD